jgi:type II secretory pathway pseudopilin PulG
MGQQQLLLVILVTVIVGIATVVAINTFGSASKSANIDAVNNDVASIAASAQAYYTKPSMMGGGGNSFSPVTSFPESSTFVDDPNLTTDLHGNAGNCLCFILKIS